MNNNLSLVAIQLLNRVMRYTESKGVILPDEIKTNLLNNTALQETLVGILAEADNLEEDSINQWGQRMQALASRMPETFELYAKLDPISPAKNKQLAISSQLAVALNQRLSFINLMVQPDAVSETLKDSSTSLVEYYSQTVVNAVHEMTQPPWRDQILFPLKYPKVDHIAREKVGAKSIALMPEPHQSKLRELMKKEGMGAAIQEMILLLSELMPTLIDVNTLRKGLLLDKLLLSMNRNGALAALASDNLSVMSKAFSEEALDAFLEAAVQSVDSAAHIERFTDSLNLTLKYPELYRAIKESVIKKIVSLMPNSYKNTLEATLQKSSLVVALQTLEVQIPVLENDHTLSPETAQKVLLVSVATNVLSQQKELLALAHEKLSVVSLALKEAFDSFVGSAVQALQEAHEDKVIDDKGQLNVHLQSCIEQFITSLKNRLINS